MRGDRLNGQRLGARLLALQVAVGLLQHLRSGPDESNLHAGTPVGLQHLEQRFHERQQRRVRGCGHLGEAIQRGAVKARDGLVRVRLERAGGIAAQEIPVRAHGVELLGIRKHHLRHAGVDFLPVAPALGQVSLVGLFRTACLCGLKQLVVAQEVVGRDVGCADQHCSARGGQQAFVQDLRQRLRCRGARGRWPPFVAARRKKRIQPRQRGHVAAVDGLVVFRLAALEFRHGRFHGLLAGHRDVGAGLVGEVELQARHRLNGHESRQLAHRINAQLAGGSVHEIQRQQIFARRERQLALEHHAPPKGEQVVDHGKQQQGHEDALPRAHHRGRVVQVAEAHHHHHVQERQQDHHQEQGEKHLFADLRGVLEQDRATWALAGFGHRGKRIARRLWQGVEIDLAEYRHVPLPWVAFIARDGRHRWAPAHCSRDWRGSQLGRPLLGWQSTRSRLGHTDIGPLRLSDARLWLRR